MSGSVAVRLPDRVIVRLRQLAEENCRTVAQTIEWILKKYDEESLEQYIERERPYIEHSLKQKPILTSVDELFHE